MGTVTTRGTRVRSWKNAVRRRDLAWIALFAALAWGGPASGPVELNLIEDGNHVANNRAYRYRTQSADWIAGHLGVGRA